MDDKQKIQLLEKLLKNAWDNFKYCNEYALYCSGAYTEDKFDEIAEQYAEEPDTLTDYTDEEIKEMFDYVKSVCNVQDVDVITLFNLDVKDVKRVACLLEDHNNDSDWVRISSDPVTQYYNNLRSLILRMYNVIINIPEDEDNVVNDLYDKISEALEISTKEIEELDYDQIYECKIILDRCTMTFLIDRDYLTTENQQREVMNISKLHNRDKEEFLYV